MTAPAPRPSASPEWIGTAMVLVSVLGFAISGPGAKMAYDGGAEPITVVAIRYATNVVGVAILLLLFRSQARLPARIRLGGLGIGALLATEAYLFLEGLKTVPVSLGVPVFFTFPLQVALLGAVLRIEALTRWRATALLLAFAGLWLMTAEGEMQADVAGIALCFLAGSVVALTVVGTGRLMRDQPKLPVALYMMTGGFALSAAGMLAVGGPILPTGSRGLTGLALTCGGFSLGIILFYVAIGFLGSVRAAILTNLQPVMSVALAMVMIAERPGVAELLGGALILTGIGVMHYGDRRTRALAISPQGSD